MSARATGASGAVNDFAVLGDELRFTTDEVDSLARDLEQRADEYHAKWGSVPDLSATACGSGFSSQGLRLQAAAARLRDHCQQMYQGLGAHGPAIKHQWREFAECDGDAGARLAGIEVSE